MGAALPFPFRDCDRTVGDGVQARCRLVQDQSSNWENCDECTKRADSPGELYQDSSAPARRIEGDWSTSHRKRSCLNSSSHPRVRRRFGHHAFSAATSQSWTPIRNHTGSHKSLGTASIFLNFAQSELKIR